MHCPDCGETVDPNGMEAEEVSTFGSAEMVYGCQHCGAILGVGLSGL